MFSERITLDRDTFKVLAAATRVDILKKLDERKHTLSDLAEAFKMSPSTIKEHLERLSAAGLIVQEEGETKWKYYLLTDKGRHILKPHETRVWIMLAVSLVFLGASVYSLVGVVPPPAFAQAPAAGGGLMKSLDRQAAPQILLESAETPRTAFAGSAKAYAYILFIVFFAVASGILTARAMRV